MVYININKRNIPMNVVRVKNYREPDIYYLLNESLTDWLKKFITEMRKTVFFSIKTNRLVQIDYKKST